MEREKKRQRSKKRKLQLANRMSRTVFLRYVSPSVQNPYAHCTAESPNGFLRFRRMRMQHRKSPLVTLSKMSYMGATPTQKKIATTKGPAPPSRQRTPRAVEILLALVVRHRKPPSNSNQIRTQNAPKLGSVLMMTSLWICCMLELLMLLVRPRSGFHYPLSFRK